MPLQLYPPDLPFLRMTWEAFEAAMQAEGFQLTTKCSDPGIPRLEYAEWESMNDREPYRLTRGRMRLTAYQEYVQKVHDRLMVTEKEDQHKVFRAAFRFARFD